MCLRTKHLAARQFERAVTEESSLLIVRSEFLEDALKNSLLAARNIKIFEGLLEDAIEWFVCHDHHAVETLAVFTSSSPRL